MHKEAPVEVVKAKDNVALKLYVRLRYSDFLESLFLVR